MATAKKKPAAKKNATKKPTAKKAPAKKATTAKAKPKATHQCLSPKSSSVVCRLTTLDIA